MEMQDEAGFFACLIPEKQILNYTYQVFLKTVKKSWYKTLIILRARLQKRKKRNSVREFVMIYTKN